MIPLPEPQWQIRLSNGDLIAGDYSWMSGGDDPENVDWDAVEGYLEDGEAAEAWWMVPTKVVHAPLPAVPDDDEDTEPPTDTKGNHDQDE